MKKMSLIICLVTLPLCASEPRPEPHYIDVLTAAASSISGVFAPAASCAATAFKEQINKDDVSKKEFEAYQKEQAALQAKIADRLAKVEERQRQTCAITCCGISCGAQCSVQ